MFDLVKGVVYKTTDGGENWTRRLAGRQPGPLHLDRSARLQVLYVSTGIFDRGIGQLGPGARRPGGVGILKSTDGGATWRVLNQANGLNNLYVGSLFMHPAIPTSSWRVPGTRSTGNIRGSTCPPTAAQSWRLTMDRRYLGGAARPGLRRPDHCRRVRRFRPDIAYAASGPGLLPERRRRPDLEGHGRLARSSRLRCARHDGRNSHGPAGRPAQRRTASSSTTTPAATFLRRTGARPGNSPPAATPAPTCTTSPPTPVDSRRVFTIGRSGRLSQRRCGATGSASITQPERWVLWPNGMASPSIRAIPGMCCSRTR